MCRMAAYQGPVIALSQFITEPEHSLFVQSYMPQELVYAKVNADGYGIGWYDDDGAPASYVQPSPIWSDPNLDSLARSMHSGLWLANVRSATAGLAVNHANTQPFHDDELLFMHNGYIRGFSKGIRKTISSGLDSEVEAAINGTTDSEYLFAMFRQKIMDDPELAFEDALLNIFEQLENWLGEQDALLNIILTDGELIYAVRHAINHACPSLYYTTDDENFPNGQLIASERMTDSDFWQPVPEHHILIMEMNQPAELVAI